MGLRSHRWWGLRGASLVESVRRSDPAWQGKLGSDRGRDLTSLFSSTHSHTLIHPPTNTQSCPPLSYTRSFEYQPVIIILWHLSSIPALKKHPSCFKQKKKTRQHSSILRSEWPKFLYLKCMESGLAKWEPFSVGLKPGVVRTEQNPIGGLPPLSQCLGSGKLISCKSVLVLLGGEKVLFFFMMNHLGDFSVRKLNYFLH